ncbi:MAG TPA: ester cyclase [Trueperaceae bacterium]
MEQERNKSLVLRMYEEVWNRGRLAFIDQAVSASFADHPPKRFFEVPTRGRESLHAAASAFRGAMPDFHDQAIQCLAEDDKIMYLGRITGTHTGKFFQFPPSGNRVNVFGINEFRLSDGKIVERWGIFDVLGMMQQMDIVPAA